jgi:hypothetical protein
MGRCHHCRQARLVPPWRCDKRRIARYKTAKMQDKWKLKQDKNSENSGAITD